jgi:hypothetical protein
VLRATTAGTPRVEDLDPIGTQVTARAFSLLRHLGPGGASQFTNALMSPVPTLGLEGNRASAATVAIDTGNEGGPNAI